MDDKFKNARQKMMSRVVDIGDFRVKNNALNRKRCQHNSVLYDPSDRTIVCADCDSPVDPFNAFLNIIRYFEKKEDSLNIKADQLAELEKKKTHLIAAKKVEEVWRSKHYLPCCPHCDVPISPHDGLGDHRVNKSLVKKIPAKKTR